MALAERSSAYVSSKRAETDNKPLSASSFAVAERADRRRGTASFVESDRRGA